MKKINIPIVKTISKIPAGNMFIPLIISMIISTISINCGLGGAFYENGEFIRKGHTLYEYLGNPVKDLFGSSGQMLLVGFIMFCIGVSLSLNDFKQMGKRGALLVFAKIIPAYVFCIIIFYALGFKGFLGIDFLTLSAVLTTGNGAVFLAICDTYGDDSDRASFPLITVLTLPLMPFLFLSSFSTGSGDINSKILQVISLLIPFVIGLILGHLDIDLKNMYSSATKLIMPFLGLQFGSSIDMVAAFKLETLGSSFILLLLFYLFSLLFPLIIEIFFLKRPGYASIAFSSVAGTSLLIPSMFLNYNFSNTIIDYQIINNGVTMMAFCLIFTNMLCPLIISIYMKLYFKFHSKKEASRIFEHSHPELIKRYYK